MLYNATRETVLAVRVRVADNFLGRLRGLLGEYRLPPGEALVLRPCRAVHSIGMRFPIDVLFLDREGRVVGARPHLPPFRPGCSCPGAWETVELPAGILAATGTLPGDLILYA